MSDIGKQIVVLAFAASMVMLPIMHIWTIGIGYAHSGLGFAVVVAFLPVFGEFIMFFLVGSESGFHSPYCLSLLALAALGGIAWLGGALTATKGSRAQEE